MATTANVDGARSFQSMNTAVQARYFDQAMFMTANAIGMGGLPRSGVIPSAYAAGFASTPLDFYVSAQTSPNMSVYVYQGSAFIGRSTQGGYLAYSTTQPTLTVATANATNPRIDLVYLQILDHALGDAGAPSLGGYAQLGISTGTPAPSPTAPALPANAVSLATILVPANSTSVIQSNITDTRKGTALNGAIRNLLAGDALSDPGYRYGENRGRFHATYGYMQDYWGTDSQWHGLQQVYPAVVWGNGTSNITITTSNTQVASCVIADPGWPYKVMVGAQIDWGSYGSSITVGGAPYTLGYLWLDSVGGTQLAVSNGFAQWNGSGIDAWTSIQTRVYPTTLTGNHTIYLGAKATVNVLSTYGNWTAGATYLTVAVIPA